MKAKNTTYRILSKLVEGLTSKDGYGASFSTLKEAQDLARACKKSKQPMSEIPNVSDILKCTKCVYSKINDTHVLFVIRDENADLEFLVDDPLDVSWCTYRPNGDKWQWFARGHGLSMMLNHAITLGADSFYFSDVAVIGTSKEKIVCAITTRTEHDPEKLIFLPELKVKAQVQPVQPVHKEEPVEQPIVTDLVPERSMDTPVKKQRRRISSK